MSVIKHTPGPWVVDHNLGSGSYVRGPEGRLVASCYWMSGKKEMPAYANARLIAAAPDLLATARALIDMMDPADDWGHPTVIAARAAISKATGEA